MWRTTGTWPRASRAPLAPDAPHPTPLRPPPRSGCARTISRRRRQKHPKNHSKRRLALSRGAEPSRRLPERRRETADRPSPPPTAPAPASFRPRLPFPARASARGEPERGSRKGGEGAGQAPFTCRASRLRGRGELPPARGASQTPYHKTRGRRRDRAPPGWGASEQAPGARHGRFGFGHGRRLRDVPPPPAARELRAATPPVPLPGTTPHMRTAERRERPLRGPLRIGCKPRPLARGAPEAPKRPAERGDAGRISPKGREGPAPAREGDPISPWGGVALPPPHSGRCSRQQVQSGSRGAGWGGGMEG